MARMTAKEIGKHLDLDNDLKHDLFLDQEERDNWENYQSDAEQEQQEWAARFDDSWLDNQPDDEIDCGYDPYPEQDWFFDHGDW